MQISSKLSFSCARVYSDFPRLGLSPTCLAPRSHDPLRIDCVLRMMANRNIYEDDVDFAVLALQSPAFNKQ